MSAVLQRRKRRLRMLVRTKDRPLPVEAGLTWGLTHSARQASKHQALGLHNAGLYSPDDSKKHHSSGSNYCPMAAGKDHIWKHRPKRATPLKVWTGEKMPPLWDGVCACSESFIPKLIWNLIPHQKGILTHIPRQKIDSWQRWNQVQTQNLYMFSRSPAETTIWAKRHQRRGTLTNQALWFGCCTDRNCDLDRDKTELLDRNIKCNPIDISAFRHDPFTQIHSSHCTSLCNGTGNTGVREP